MLHFLKNWTLPVAIAVGVFFYFLFANTPALDEAATVLGPVCETLLPVTLFLTLFITFSKVDFHLMKLQRWHLAVFSAQLLMVALLVGLILYTEPLFTFLSHQFNDCDASHWQNLSTSSFKLLLEAVLICIIAPCASASPVVTAKLGGDLTQMTTFVLLSSIIISLLIPAVFPLLEPHQFNTSTSTISQLSFFNSQFLSAFLAILKRLALVLLLPLFLGAIVRHWVKPLYQWFIHTPDLGFYCWSVSLAITSGITMKNIVHSGVDAEQLGLIAVLTLMTSLIQFRIGRHIGDIYDEHVCTAQAMFQKNTGLAIWIAYIYLTPVASIGAGCYVLWQNIINSYELWQHRKHRL